MDVVYYWVRLIDFGYRWVTPVLLICWLLFKTLRPFTISFIAVSNGWYCFSTFLFSGYWLSVLFFAWYSQNQYEGYRFYYSRTNNLLPAGLVLGLQIITFLLSFLFILKRFRKSILFTGILVLIMAVTSETFIRFISRFHQDYLPSSWKVVQPQHWWKNDVVYSLTYLLIIISTYFIQQKRAKRFLLAEP